MSYLKNKNYVIVDKENLTFNEIFKKSWSEIKTTTEDFKESERLLIINESGNAFATLEIVNYNKGFENLDVEEAFNFSKFQNERTDLFYIDKLAILKEDRGDIENLSSLLKALFFYTLGNKKSNKKIVLVALIQKGFYDYLKNFLNLEIEELSNETINNEIPILIDLFKNKEILKSGNWNNIF